MQLFGGLKTGAFEQAPDQDTKPNLHLIEPGTMLGGVDEADAMAGVGEEVGAGFHGLENTAFVFDPEIDLDALVLRDPLDQGGRLMGIEVIDDKQPLTIGIGGNGLLQMS